jgi:hypothetical protein
MAGPVTLNSELSQAVDSLAAELNGNCPLFLPTISYFERELNLIFKNLLGQVDPDFAPGQFDALKASLKALKEKFLTFESCLDTKEKEKLARHIKYIKAEFKVFQRGIEQSQAAASCYESNGKDSKISDLDCECRWASPIIKLFKANFECKW